MVFGALLKTGMKALTGELSATSGSSRSKSQKSTEKSKKSGASVQTASGLTINAKDGKGLTKLIRKLAQEAGVDVKTFLSGKNTQPVQSQQPTTPPSQSHTTNYRPSNGFGFNNMTIQFENSNTIRLNNSGLNFIG
jgi:uncharacterized membrane protein YebE (DUF533 family)